MAAAVSAAPLPPAPPPAQRRPARRPRAPSLAADAAARRPLLRGVRCTCAAGGATLDTAAATITADGGAMTAEAAGGGAPWQRRRRGALPARHLTVLLRDAGSVEALVDACSSHLGAMNPIHATAALVAAARLKERGRWLARDADAGADGAGADGTGTIAAADAARRRVELEAERLPSTVAALVSRLAAQRALCGGREIASSLWALARLGAPPPPPRVLRALLAQFSDALPATSCTSIAHALHALASMRPALAPPPPEWTDQALYSFVAHATAAAAASGAGVGRAQAQASPSGQQQQQQQQQQEEEEEQRQQLEDGAIDGGADGASDRDPWACSPQAVSNVVWALARFGQRGVARVWVPALVRLLRARRGAAAIAPQVAANVLSACAKLALTPAAEARAAAWRGAGRPPAAAAAASYASAAADDDDGDSVSEQRQQPPHHQQQHQQPPPASAGDAAAAALAADLLWLLDAVAPRLGAARPCELAALGWAVGQLELAPGAGFVDALFAASRDAMRSGALGPRELAGLAHGAARRSIALRAPPPPADWVAALLAAAGAALPRMTAADASVTLWAVAALGVRPAPAWLDAAVGDFAARVPALGAAAAVAAAAAEHEEVEEEEAGAAAPAPPPAAAADAAAAVSRALRALAEMRYRPAAPALAALLAAAERLAPALPPHALASLLWALARLDVRPPLALLGRCLARLDGTLPAMQARDAVDVAYALSRLQVRVCACDAMICFCWVHACREPAHLDPVCANNC